MPPAGFKRSRALWDQARGMVAHQSTTQKWQVLLRAILYELQPIRFSRIDTHQMVRTARSLGSNMFGLFAVKLPMWLKSTVIFLRNVTRKQWLIVAGVIVYYCTVRWIHNVLEAGPLVLIVTALLVIWTVGLGEGNADGSLSAYSVFNRGFQRLLGSVDENQLLAAHVGGGLAGLGMMNQQNNNDDDWRPAHRRDLNDDDDDWRPINRREQHQPAGRQEQPNVVEAPAEGDDTAQPEPVNRARPSGKKARRRNLEQRREQRSELERQREAAAHLGFGEGQEAEMRAMHRLVEEAAAGHGE